MIRKSRLVRSVLGCCSLALVISIHAQDTTIATVERTFKPSIAADLVIAQRPIITRLLAPGETRHGAVRQLEVLIGGLGLASAITVEAAPPSYEPFAIDPGHPAMQAFEAAYRVRLGRDPSLGGLLGITDANIYQGEGGIPTIIFGPKGQGLHEKDEYVELDSLAPVVDILVDTTRRFFETRS